MTQKNLLKKVAPMVLTAAMLFGMTSMAFAKTNKTAVQNVTIDLEYDLAPGMNSSQVDADSDSVGVDNVNVTSVTNTDFGKKPNSPSRARRGAMSRSTIRPARALQSPRSARPQAA